MFLSEKNLDWEIKFNETPSIKKLYLELTNNCNLSCGMCYRHSRKWLHGEMEEKLFVKILREIKTLPILEEIVLGGFGEPMIHSKFWEFLEMINLSLPKVRLELTSNGLLLTAETVEKLAALGVSRIVVSVDGADSATQQQIRGIEASEVNEKLLKLGQTVGKNPEITWWWETVWQEKNKHELPELVKLAGRCHVEQVIVSHLLAVTPEQTGQALYDPELAAENVKIIGRAINLALLNKVALHLPKHKLVTERNCQFVRSLSTVIGWDGRVSPCYRFLHGCQEYFFNRQKEVTPFQFGWLTKEKLDYIWRKAGYQTFRYRVINSIYPSCPDCDLLNGCDIVSRAEGDCDGGIPACGDCLWSRGMIYCP
jgi:tungsten cofactor oxidoreducase radical SAM maturase